MTYFSPIAPSYTDETDKIEVLEKSRRAQRDSSNSSGGFPFRTFGSCPVIPGSAGEAFSYLGQLVAGVRDVAMGGIGARFGVDSMVENFISAAVHIWQQWRAAPRGYGALGTEEGMRGEARGHDGSHGGCRWPRRRGTAAAVTAFSWSDRAARLNTGPDRHFLGPKTAARTGPVFPSGLNRTVRSLTGHERAEKACSCHPPTLTDKHHQPASARPDDKQGPQPATEHPLAEAQD